MVWGLDMRFLGGKWQKKINSDRNGSGMRGLAFPDDGPFAAGLERGCGKGDFSVERFPQ
jgi:hypothetical protein